MELIANLIGGSIIAGLIILTWDFSKILAAIIVCYYYEGRSSDTFISLKERYYGNLYRGGPRKRFSLSSIPAIDTIKKFFKK